MRRVLFAIFLFTFKFSSLVYGQSPIDLDAIKLATLDSGHEHYYPKLVDEFLKSPEYFPLAKGTYIYYGQLYSKNYKVFNISKEKTDFDKFLSRQNFKKAITLGEKMLAENPVDLEILAKMGFCYDKNGQQELAGNIKSRIDVLRRVILSSGVGDSFESPFKVVSVADEYVIMGIEGIQGISRSSKGKEDSTVDIWSVQIEGSKEEKTLCFEVLRNMDAISNFKNKTR